jgi:SAM-dependent methyltransferase
MTEPTFLDATRVAYDTIATSYTERFRDELLDLPVDLALLGAFAHRVRAAGAGPVLEVGSGPGEVTAYLHGLGADVSGVDLSPAMVAQARADHPHLRFDLGSMTALDRPDGSLGGLVAFYSTIHLPTDRLPDLFAEFRRVLAPGGELLLGFLTGDEKITRTEAFGHEIRLDYYLRPVALVADLLRAAGFRVDTRVDREPGRGENIPRGYLLATS